MISRVLGQSYGCHNASDTILNDDNKNQSKFDHNKSKQRATLVDKFWEILYVQNDRDSLCFPTVTDINRI